MTTYKVDFEFKCPECRTKVKDWSTTKNLNKISIDTLDPLLDSFMGVCPKCNHQIVFKRKSEYELKVAEVKRQFNFTTYSLNKAK